MLKYLRGNAARTKNSGLGFGKLRKEILQHSVNLLWTLAQ